MITTNVIRNPMRLTAAHPTYCQVFCPFAFHHDDPTFSLTALIMGGLGPLPRLAPAPPSLLQNSPRTRPPPPAQAHQWTLERAISSQTSPHQWGCRLKDSPPTLTVTSSCRAVLVRTTIIRLTLGRAKIRPQFMTPFWNYQI